MPEAAGCRDAAGPGSPAALARWTGTQSAPGLHAGPLSREHLRGLPVRVGWDQENEKEAVSTQEHFVRGIKLQLDGKSGSPAASSELATITDVSDAKVWTSSGRKAETDPANA